MDDPNPTSNLSPDPTTRIPTPEPVPSPAYVAPPPAPMYVAPPPAPPAPPAPSWAPPKQRDDGGRWVGIIGGLILLGLGLWFFAERTLGLDLPDIRWSQMWPLILILIGAAILLGAFRRERR